MTILHTMGEAIRQMLQQVPLSAVRALFVLTLVLVFIWVMRMPSSVTTPEGGARRWDENLKLGAGLALGIQIVIYLWL